MEHREQEKRPAEAARLPWPEAGERGRESLPRGRYHFLMETEDGEGVGIDGADLSAYLKKHGRRAEAGS